MSVFASIRRSACLFAFALAMAPVAFAPVASGQELPFDKVSGSELRQALIWTGHLELWDGDPLAAVQKATKSWQAAKGYKQTDTLNEDQTSELLAEAVQHRSAVGWSTLQDKQVGLSVGIPTKLTKFTATRPINGGFRWVSSWRRLMSLDQPSTWALLRLSRVASVSRKI